MKAGTLLSVILKLGNKLCVCRVALGKEPCRGLWSKSWLSLLQVLS